MLASDGIPCTIVTFVRELKSSRAFDELLVRFPL